MSSQKPQSFWRLARVGKNFVGWYYGFKLHLIINDQGELLAFQLTPANIDDRQPVPDLTKHLFGKLFGDKGYISQSLFEQLYQRGFKLITRYRKKRMRPRAADRRKGTRTKQVNNRLVQLIERILLRKRAIIESVNDQLKNICQIQHTRHRGIYNFMVNLLGGLVAYTYHPIKPALDLEVKGLPALPPAIF